MLDKQLIEVCKESAQATFSMMAGTEVELGEILEKESNIAWGDVTGVIGLSSQAIRGCFAISFETAALLPMVSKMLMESFSEINEDVIDAVGEITNVISGKVKALLIDSGYQIDWSTPIVVVGKGVQIASMVTSPTYQLPFSCEYGKFVIEVGYKI